MNVPLVPRPATKCVRRPLVCSMISGAGRVVMRAPVRVVAVLIRIKVALRIRRDHPAHFADRAVGALERTGQHELGAERAKNQLPLRARVLGQAQLHFVAARRADHRVRDAGVARGRIDDRQAGPQAARRLRRRRSSARRRDLSPIRRDSATRPSRRARRRASRARNGAAGRAASARSDRARTRRCDRPGQPRVTGRRLREKTTSAICDLCSPNYTKRWKGSIGPACYTRGARE